MAKYGEEGTVKMLDGQVVKARMWEASAPEDRPLAFFWPEGGYYWTVVPIYMKTTTGDGIEYRDLQLPEDVCRAGGSVRFGKIGKPVVLADNNAPYISGLSPNGKLVGAKKGAQSFYGHPLVAWEPVYGAHEYEVQWSRTLKPLAPRRHAADDAGHRGRAARQSRSLVLQGSRTQPVTPQAAGDDVVEAGLTPHREAALPRRQALARTAPS